MIPSKYKYLTLTLSLFASIAIAGGSRPCPENLLIKTFETRGDYRNYTVTTKVCKKDWRGVNQLIKETRKTASRLTRAPRAGDIEQVEIHTKEYSLVNQGWYRDRAYDLPDEVPNSLVYEEIESKTLNHAENAEDNIKEHRFHIKRHINYKQRHRGEITEIKVAGPKDDITLDGFSTVYGRRPLNRYGNPDLPENFEYQFKYTKDTLPSAPLTEYFGETEPFTGPDITTYTTNFQVRINRYDNVFGGGIEYREGDESNMNWTGSYSATNKDAGSLHYNITFSPDHVFHSYKAMLFRNRWFDTPEISFNETVNTRFEDFIGYKGCEYWNKFKAHNSLFESKAAEAETFALENFEVPEPVKVNPDDCPSVF